MPNRPNAKMQVNNLRSVEQISFKKMYVPTQGRIGGGQAPPHWETRRRKKIVQSYFIVNKNSDVTYYTWI